MRRLCLPFLEYRNGRANRCLSAIAWRTYTVRDVSTAPPRLSHRPAPTFVQPVPMRPNCRRTQRAKRVAMILADVHSEAAQAGPSSPRTASTGRCDPRDRRGRVRPGGPDGILRRRAHRGLRAQARDLARPPRPAITAHVGLADTRIVVHNVARTVCLARSPEMNAMSAVQAPGRRGCGKDYALPIAAPSSLGHARPVSLGPRVARLEPRFVLLG
ncbi:hypothetical protein FA95DRAFT_985138 [Auriscalpium vulgare]|uniref:Uncharacterized protein n=1 Tax=Auriscalpium vulgare TaxID=40419 RepID=A0ACB8R888_9AGAM|nr:hypothetical protein FA95DRAFT_985138 [Auriscalpium vulgare]